MVIIRSLLYLHDDIFVFSFHIYKHVQCILFYLTTGYKETKSITSKSKLLHHLVDVSTLLPPISKFTFYMGQLTLSDKT